MLSTAIALADETRSILKDDEVLTMASVVYRSRDLEADQFKSRLFDYTALIAAKVADRVSKLFLTEKEIADLQKTIDEMIEIEESIVKEEKDGK